MNLNLNRWSHVCRSHKLGLGRGNKQRTPLEVENLKAVRLIRFTY